jgi:hypothetical protein
VEGSAVEAGALVQICGAWAASAVSPTGEPVRGPANRAIEDAMVDLRGRVGRGRWGADFAVATAGRLFLGLVGPFAAFSGPLWQRVVGDDAILAGQQA